jgi:two-component system nitrate/nitrite response regulator NarL
MTSQARNRKGAPVAAPKSTEALQEQQPIGLFIVGAVRLHREALVCLFASEDRLRILGEADPDMGLDRIRDTAPDVVLVDVASGDGADLIRALRRVLPDCTAIAFGISEVESEVLACAEAGALGYVSRRASLGEAIRAIRGAAKEEAICSPRITAALLRRLRALALEQVTGTEDAHLTFREIEVLRLIDRGLSNKEIAQLLSIETTTVKNHVHNILLKLNLHRRGQATAWLRHGDSLDGSELPGSVPFSSFPEEEI